MQEYYVDLHIHIGRTESGVPVKITGARNLTFFNIAREASRRKGIDVIGIIDCHSPAVQEEMDRYLDQGDMVELAEGGIRYGTTTILPGTEIEVHDEGFGPAHLLVYLPTLEQMRSFTRWLSRGMKNVTLSSQRLYVPARDLQAEVLGRGGLFIPAHIFTPHKSIYGSCTDRMGEVLDLAGISAVELGLSSDTLMASYLSELDPFSFVTNSDAHSLGKIGREYNRMALKAPNFREVALALGRKNGRRITANYGLDPRLGKYHRSYCLNCERILEEAEAAAERCPACHSPNLTRGVLDRILSIADRPHPQPAPHHPPYYYQVPLEYIPGLGPKTFNRLLERFGTEMNILHCTTREELAEAAGPSIADMILKAREGRLSLQSGGGGRYGKVART